MRNKKGASPVMWLIVVMVLALAVLVILMIVTGKGFADFFTGAYDCENKGGVCQADCGDNAPLLGQRCAPEKCQGAETCICCSKT